MIDHDIFEIIMIIIFSADTRKTFQSFLRCLDWLHDFENEIYESYPLASLPRWSEQKN